MSEELVKIENNLSEGGTEIDFGSKLFRLKPTTLAINQSNSQTEGIVPGMFRMSTGEQFKELTATLLVMPKEWRQYHMGNEKPGLLNKIPDNLLCYSHDMIRPDPRSRQLQAITCASCTLSQWDNSVEPHKPPLCDPFYFATFIDTETQWIFNMYLRGANRTPFEEFTSNLARALKQLKVAGEKPNLWDISFKLTTVRYKNKQEQVNYKLKVDNKTFKLITPEMAQEFGGLYLDYVNYGKTSEVEEQLEQIVDTNDAINGAINDTINGTIDGEVINGEIVI